MRFVIQSHPARDTGRVLCSLPTAEVVEDPDPQGKPSAWRTYRACLETGGPLCIVQDDAICVPGFAEAVEVAAAEKPDALVSFFHSGFPEMKVVIWDHLKRKQPFWQLTVGKYVPTVALLWPACRVEEFLYWIDHLRKPKPDFLGDDSLVGDWTRFSKCPAFTTVPSLVQHPDDLPSLTLKRANRRVAVAIAADGNEWISLVRAESAVSAVTLSDQ